MIKKLKAQMLKLGLNPKKELLTLLIGNISLITIGVAVYFIFKQILYSGICLGVALVYDLVFLSRYSKQIDGKNVQNLQEFATLFGYFRIFIHNGYSVYSALKELLNFANPDLKKLLEKLISDDQLLMLTNLDRSLKDKLVEHYKKDLTQFTELEAIQSIESLKKKGLLK